VYYLRLVEHLRDGNGVRSRAGVAVRVGDVALVVWAIGVLAVPACREADADHDARRAGLGREVQRLPASRHRSLKACEVHILVLCLQLLRRAEVRVADGHPEARLEGGHLACSASRC